MESTKLNEIRDTKHKLDHVSPSFCAAKWLQVTLHLQNGHNHSCHHPNTHRADSELVTSNPSALHNTEHKQEQRRLMLKGERPSECGYCWDIEDTSSDAISDRHIKSNDPWAKRHLTRISSLPINADISPTYVEASFSNLCNFKCAYCSPHISSKWMEEIRQHGPYPTSTPYNDIHDYAITGKQPIAEHEPNPYLEAFWRWWPELYRTLEVFRITGGEPLLSRHTFRILDHVDAAPNPTLDLAINSNLDVPTQLMDAFVSKAKILCDKQKTRTFTLYTSIDAWGPQAEYIRHGLSYERFLSNVERFLRDVQGAELVFNCTLNALSVPSLERLLEDVASIKSRHDRWMRPGQRRITFDCAYLRHPDFLALSTLPRELGEPLEIALAAMQSQPETFAEFECAKLSRVLSHFTQLGEDTDRARRRVDLARFVDEHDRRRGTDFAKTFPELASWIAQIRR